MLLPGFLVILIGIPEWLLSVSLDAVKIYAGYQRPTTTVRTAEAPDYQQRPLDPWIATTPVNPSQVIIALGLASETAVDPGL